LVKIFFKFIFFNSLLGGGAVCILILLFLVFYFYRKYNWTRKVLNYEVQDVRNVGTGPKDISELKDVSDVTISTNKRYQNLEEDNISQMTSKI